MLADERKHEPEPDMRYYFRWVLDGLDELYGALDGVDFQSVCTGAYLLKGELSRLNVQKVDALLGHLLSASEGAGELAMETEISDRFAYAACKCEEVYCEVGRARGILKSVLGEDRALESGNGNEILTVPPLAFNKTLRNQIAILAGPEGKAHDSEYGLRRGLAGGLKAMHKFHMKMLEGGFSLSFTGNVLEGGKTSRLRVEKLLETVSEIEEHMEHVVKQAMEGTTQDRLAFAACKCEEVRREMIEAIKTLNSILEAQHLTGNTRERLLLPSLAFKESLLNEIAILSGRNARTKFD